MAIEIRSFNQILGDMLRKVIADTPLNDINTGSVLLTLLEAVAANDFQNNTAILNVLELMNIDSLRNSDLDAKAADFGLTRLSAIKASGFVSIQNTNITKRSTGLYVIKPAPIAGQTILYVNSTNGWAPTGTLYIGRGTTSFEGPINYTAITVYPTYSEITLASALQKDHLVSEYVIDAQGEPDRLIGAGTVVKIPANNQSPEVQYVTLRDAVIPAGEDVAENIEVIALLPGSLGNAGINTITDFDTAPFSGAAVVNTNAFSNGKDIETDNELRNRIKSYTLTLARGTAPSIVAAVIGISDPDDNKQVASAVITEPVKVGDPSILYIDDGYGFEPSYEGQSVDILLNDAEGTEEFLQLANYPLPRPQVINTAEAPFVMIDGMTLRVIVDGKEEVISFASSQFVNMSAATVAEVVSAINSNSTTFKARLTDDSTQILIYPVEHDVETIQVPASNTEDETYNANSVLKFPTNELSYISLYQNSTRLREKSKSATLETAAFAAWNVTSSGNLSIAVDGTPSQDRTFLLSDFVGAASWTTLTLDQWVEVFNSKFAGITAEATSNQTLKITSNKIGSSSSLFVSDGTYLNKLFPNQSVESVGQSAQFELNRQTGNLRILTDIEPGDKISAGVEDAKGFAISSTTISGAYNVASDGDGRPSIMVVVSDSSYCEKKSLNLTNGSTINITNPSGSRMRIMASTNSMFASLLPGDYIYITEKTSGWLSAANCGLFQVVNKGSHTVANTNSFIEVNNVGVAVEGPITIVSASDIRAFTTDGFPQVWRGSYVSNPPAEPISGIVASLNKDLIGVKASIYKSNSIKVTSTTEQDGSIAIPVAMSNAGLLFTETNVAQVGNPPHIANKKSTKQLVSFFRRTEPSASNVWLDRHTYTHDRNTVNDIAPSTPPFSSTYSEILTSALTLNALYDDYVSVFSGTNKGQFRSIKAIMSPTQIGTQHGVARTELDYAGNPDIDFVRPISLSSEDSIVVAMDNDATSKTIDIKMARNARVNTGSGGSFSPTTTEFSANDLDNEPGINFSSLTVWGIVQNNTDFSDYAIWMRARNWYAGGGLSSGQGKMLVRSAQFGPNGEKLRFAIDYPSAPDQQPTTVYSNENSYSKLTYLFGSGAAKPIALSSSDTVAVDGPYPDDSTNFPAGATSSGNYYDYTFSAGNFAAVITGDVLSVISGSGVSKYNSGQFRVANKSGFTVRVFNPKGSPTSLSANEVVTSTAITDVAGSASVFTITTVADVAGSLHQTYFLIGDREGTVAVWFDVDNVGAEPPTHGANRAIKVSSVVSNDSANNVATAIYNALQLDSAFNNSVLGNQVTITNVAFGTTSAASASTSGFATATTPGTATASLNGKYFTIHDQNGSVAVWFDTDNRGTVEPLHGANRSIKVSTIISGDSATNVASKIATAVNADADFTASNLGAVITITNTSTGNMPDATSGTSGFAMSNSDGSFGGDEVISNPNAINIYALTGTDVATIVSTVNSGSVLELVAVGSDSLTIDKATREDNYSWSGNSTALAYNHNPNGINDYVSLYDSVNWVKSFLNANPNFTMKTTFTLNGVAPSIYAMDICPNNGTSDLGEAFKLIPVTIKNIYHHFTQKALSQLPIVANVNISDDRKNIQISSKNLGSDGAIEVIGGNANKSEAYIVSESEISSDTTGKTLLLKIPAFPDTFNVGDYIKISNDSGVKRLSRLLTSDSINVTTPSSNKFNYNFKAKTTNITGTTQFTITDVSHRYDRPAGIVWRWEHDGSATLADVREGDVVMAFGSSIPWAMGNRARTTGGGSAGLPIISVNDSDDYFDVVNPNGKAMSSTAVGVGNTVQVCPTPTIKWELRHAAPIKTTSIVGGGVTITINCNAPHRLNTGDFIDIKSSPTLSDGTYGPITVLSQNQLTFSNATVMNETLNGPSIIKSGLIPTKYKVEKLGFNDLIRISAVNGTQNPRFADCGVAVDDYVSISGSTFKANNNGLFRVVGVSNDAIIIENKDATEELATIEPLNDYGRAASWMANVNTVTGIAGTFRNVKPGDWVKKSEDPDSYYCQVVSLTPSTPALATQITLGTAYPGSTASAIGVSYDQLNDAEGGVVLQGANDISVYEGDSALTGDTLYIQNIVNTNWFNQNNIGSFEINEINNDPTTYLPFIQITNSAGIVESNRLMSVDVNGLYVVESNLNKIESIRKIEVVAIDDINPDRRSLYVTPHNRSYKFNEANNTKVSHMGKIGYNTDVTSGIDGYTYYTGLLRRVQRTVDGYEPDAETFPGRRAIGGAIETLPPLTKKISISLNITTDEGINLGDITNNIKSVTINYVQGLGVGEDVILSEIIASIMQIKGVAATTFTYPVPSTERITIASNERATIAPSDIGVS
jgi:uncharacterized phage protein gp47/JayE